MPIQSTVLPSPRSEFAHGRNEEIFIMFGGQGDSGLLNDLYTFNLKQKVWEYVPITSITNPTPRKGSCLAANHDLVFIFGGYSESGYMNELWVFDRSTNSYELLTSKNIIPPESAFSSCHVYANSDKQIIFQTYMGETIGETPLSFIYEYNFATKEWNKIRDEGQDKISRTKTATFRILDKFIIAGGVKWDFSSHNDINILNIQTGDIVQIEDQLPYTYFGGSVYYKDKIYIHGGAYSFGNLPLKDISTNNLIAIELSANCNSLKTDCITVCSKGTYYSNGECYICPEGSYSEIDGPVDCELCPMGFYSDIKGGDSSRVCKRCPYGTFNNKIGQSRCTDCPYGRKCSFEKVIHIEQAISLKSYTSIQPELLENEEETAKTSSSLFGILIGVLGFISIALVLSFSSTRKWLVNLDMYSMQHNYGNNCPLYIRKTIIGGIFSLIFIFVALYLLYNRSIYFAIDNVMEIKALVPVIALEQQYGEVINK